jgi:hypothetical protein
MLAPRPVHRARRSQACGTQSALSGHPDALSGHPDALSGGPDALSGQPDAQLLPLRRLAGASLAFTPPTGAKVSGMSFGISGMVPSLRYE